mmetsp:Transcript_968/g.2488  ORF Transcript_968/g.2488 Transcript_968/m.2488 type:complete len:384 (-) Transcript_968:493-1644(-)
MRHLPVAAPEHIHQNVLEFGLRSPFEAELAQSQRIQQRLEELGMIVEGGFGKIAKTASTHADEVFHRRSAELAEAQDAQGMQLEFLKQRLLELSSSEDNGFNSSREMSVMRSNMSQRFSELKTLIADGFSSIMDKIGILADEVQVLGRRSAESRDAQGMQLEFVKQRLLELSSSVENSFNSTRELAVLSADILRGFSELTASVVDGSTATSTLSTMTTDALERINAMSRSVDRGFSGLMELPTLVSDVLQRKVTATMYSVVQESFRQVQDALLAEFSGCVKAEVSQALKSESSLQRLLARSTDVSEDFASLRSHLEKHLAQSERMWQRLEELGMIFEGGSIGITRTPSHTVGARAWQLVAGRRRSKSSAGQLDGDVGADMAMR